VHGAADANFGGKLYSSGKAKAFFAEITIPAFRAGW
jgi:hypothetical protein